VEYGDVDLRWDVAIPFLASQIHSIDMLTYTSIPQVGLNGGTDGLLTGGVVGGGSQVNGMAFDRGSKPDYDVWEQLGSPGWNWESLFKYFKKVRMDRFLDNRSVLTPVPQSSTFTPPKPEVQAKYNWTWDPSTYGDGPVQIGFPSWQWPDVGGSVGL
jgi:choline dehydrogenase-like flavoprotein